MKNNDYNVHNARAPAYLPPSKRRRHDQGEVESEQNVQYLNKQINEFGPHSPVAGRMHAATTISNQSCTSTISNESGSDLNLRSVFRAPREAKEKTCSDLASIDEYQDGHEMQRRTGAEQAKLAREARTKLAIARGGRTKTVTPKTV